PPAEELKTLAAATLSPATAPDVSKTVVARADALADAVPEIEYDLTARAKSLGEGVEPAFAFVRDQIRFECYDGVLRGSHGTDTARAGNAADRALLLSAILKAKGVETRYARGKLAQADAEKLLERMFESPAPSAST